MARAENGQLPPGESATYRRVGRTLQAGLLGSIAVMLVGLALVGASGSARSSHPLSVDQVARRLISGDPAAVLDAGILLLFLAPLLGVVVALLEFLRRGDRQFMITALLLLIIIALGFALALH